MKDQAEQIKNDSNLHDTSTNMAENMLTSSNILDLDKLLNKNAI